VTFRKVLIANRGEIAIRVQAACRELGIPTVAIYTEDDSDSLHVSGADEAILIEPGPRAGYLDPDQIAEAAVRTGADAVHPGYGHLADQPSLSLALGQRNVAFIGPTPRTIDIMGDNLTARTVAQLAGVPVVRASPILTGVRDAAQWADRLGYPVVVRTGAAGDGQKCWRATSPGALENALREATRDDGGAGAGGRRIYLEKFVPEPRHIEIQVACDKRGNRVHLGERDCSIQRRNRKLVEIAPSLVLGEKARRELGSAALRLCAALQYDSVGGVEFLVDGDGRFFFSRMTTRLEAGHAVTELVTGVDLVKEMIRAAAEEPLSVSQEDISPRGVAIGCRIHAEDPRRNFFRSTGRITRYLSPGGVGVRLDSCLHAGCEVSADSEPLVSRLSAWGRDWDEALARMSRALREYTIRGLQTTVPFYEKLIADPDFRAGRFTSHLMEEKIDAFRYPEPVEPLDPFFVSGAALFAHFLAGGLPTASVHPGGEE
jgi:acetyl/propionyl-CoA carboxylase alpha subunit